MKTTLSRLSLLLVLLCGPALADGKAEAMRMVGAAIDLLAAQGLPALAAIGTPNGAFHEGPKYVFVYNDKVEIVAHPGNPSLVGRSYAGKPDVRGFTFRDAIVENTLKDGESWTTYHYQKPGAAGIHEKTTFCRKAMVEAEALVVCSGVYQ